MARKSFDPVDLSNKKIVVTGGTTGIGKATAMALVEEGANVLIFGRHEKELNTALQALEKVGKGRVYGLTADQSKAEELERVFEEADEKLGKIDILINNAGISGEALFDLDFDELKYLLDTNIFGYMACCKLAGERMQARGEGHIVNVGSMSAEQKEADGHLYVATKTAIRGFSIAFRKYVNEMGIRVTLIEPGSVGTDMTAEETPPGEQKKKQEKGEMLKAEDIAQSVLYALRQPARCDIVTMQVRPHLELL